MRLVGIRDAVPTASLSLLLLVALCFNYKLEAHMKNPSELLRHGQVLAKRNSPAILTALGVTGVVTTAYLASKASFKAPAILEAAKREKSFYHTGEEENEFSLEPKEKFLLLWKLYIPAVVSGATTIGCVVMATRIGTRRTAAMAAAYTLSERAYSEYKDKVVETIGKTKSKKIEDEVAQNHLDDKPFSKQGVVIGSGDVPCFDAYSGRYFACTMEGIKKAQNDVNYTMLHTGYASLNDFYEKLGQDRTKMGDELGWNNDIPLEVIVTTCMTDDDRPALHVDFRDAPTAGYWRGH